MGESDELITLDEYDEDDMNVVVETINDDIVGNDIIKKALDENGFTTPELYDTIMKEFNNEKSKNEDEIQKLKERIEEMEIESDIEKMEFEEQINNLQTKLKDCQCKNGAENNKENPKEESPKNSVKEIISENSSASSKMSVDECFKIISLQEAVIKDKDSKIQLFLKKIKDWGINEDKIYEEPKRKKSKSDEHLGKDKEDLKVPALKKKIIPKPKIKEEPTATAEDELHPARRKSQRFIKEEPVEEPIEDNPDVVDPYDFDWLEIPVRLYDVTSSSKLRKTGRRKVKRKEETKIPTFTTQDVSTRISDTNKENGDKDVVDVTEEKFFYFAIQPSKAKTSKNSGKKRKSVRFSLD